MLDIKEVIKVTLFGAVTTIFVATLKSLLKKIKQRDQVSSMIVEELADI